MAIRSAIGARTSRLAQQFCRKPPPRGCWCPRSPPARRSPSRASVPAADRLPAGQRHRARLEGRDRGGRDRDRGPRARRAARVAPATFSPRRWAVGKRRRRDRRKARARALRIMAAARSRLPARCSSSRLLTRSFVAMVGQDRGFLPGHVLTARLAIARLRLHQRRAARGARAVLDPARALPGRPAVALTRGLPLSGSETLTAFTMPSVRPPVPSSGPLSSIGRHAGRFAALGLRLAPGSPVPARGRFGHRAENRDRESDVCAQVPAPIALGDRFPTSCGTTAMRSRSSAWSTTCP